MIRLAHVSDTHLDAEARVNGKIILGPDVFFAESGNSLEST